MGSTGWTKERVQLYVGIAGVAIVAFFVVAAVAVGGRSDRPASPAASAPSRTPTPAGPTMDPLPGKAYKIDDCFGCREKPGTWTSAGARDDEVCTWFVQRDLVGDANSVIDTGRTGPGKPVRVALEVGQYFTSTGCATWKWVG